jgi:transcriptional regulator with XRE-family HTH domain
MSTVLKLERIKHGMNQEALAAKIMSNQKRICYIERGLRARPKEVSALATVFNVSPDYLFTKEGIARLAA